MRYECEIFQQFKLLLKLVQLKNGLKTSSIIERFRIEVRQMEL